ncbi:helix-turn-helix domain-containing protein [Alloyangia pacifica]|nr:helix-turn-helix domain-containing protein [Alloyangia pacifica]
MDNLQLSGREKAIFTFWRAGLTDSEIVRKVGCSEEFVSTTRRRIELAANKPSPTARAEAQEALDAAVAELWSAGIPDVRIADRLKCGRSTVARTRARLGLATLPRKKSIDDAELRRLHGAGQSDAEMAKALGVARGTVADRRAYLGLVRNRATDGALRIGPQAFTEAQLRAAHAEGLSDKEIAERFDVSTKTIGNWRRKYGLDVHSDELTAEDAVSAEEVARDAMLRRAARCAFALAPEDQRLLPMLEPYVAEEMLRARA